MQILSQGKVCSARPIADVSRPTVTDPRQTPGNSLSIPVYIKGVRLVEKEMYSPSFPYKKLTVNWPPKTDKTNPAP